MKKLISFQSILIIFLIVLTAFFPLALNAQWQQTNGPNGGWSMAIYSANGYLFAGSNGAGIFRSSDNGNSWINILTFSEYLHVNSFVSHGQYIFAATSNTGVYRSSDDGNSWITVNNGFPHSNYSINDIVSSGQYLICGSYRVFRSSNNGVTWDSCMNGLTGPLYVYSLSSIGTNVYAGTNKGAYVTTNSGSDWISINNGISTQIVDKIGTDGLNLYAGTSNGVYKSTNNGVVWFLVNNGIPSDWYYDIIFDGVYLYSTTLSGMYRTSNGGLNWESCNNGIVSLAVIKFYLSGNRLFCASFGGAGIQYTTNHGSLWIISNNGFHAFEASSIATKDNLIYACGYMQGLAVTSNDGLSWQPVSNNLIDRYVNSVATNNNCIFLGDGSGGILKSTNNGLNWYQCNNGIIVNNSRKLVFAFDDVVFASSYEHSYRSTNNGESWSAFAAPSQIESIARIGNVIIAGNSFMELGGLIRSTDNGATWTTSYQFRPAGIVAKENVFYFHSFDSLYKSTDLGLTWVSFTSNFPGAISKMYVINNKLVLLSSLGIYTSSNNGVDWIARSQGLPSNFELKCLTVKGDYVYLGISRHGVWKRSKVDLLSVKTISSEVPSSCLLHQNYPNPFNPVTNIRFDIPRSSHVKLIIYDALGREVATLVNEKLSAGSYETNWDGSGYPSGVYFYRLQTEGFIETKKMVLLK